MAHPIAPAQLPDRRDLDPALTGSEDGSPALVPAPGAIPIPPPPPPMPHVTPTKTSPTEPAERRVRPGKTTLPPAQPLPGLAPAGACDPPRIAAPAAVAAFAEPTPAAHPAARAAAQAASAVQVSAPRRQAAEQLVKPDRLIALLDLDGADDLDALAAGGDLVPVRLGSTALVRYRLGDVAALLAVDPDTAAALLGVGTDCLGRAA